MLCRQQAIRLPQAVVSALVGRDNPTPASRTTCLCQDKKAQSETKSHNQGESMSLPGNFELYLTGRIGVTELASYGKGADDAAGETAVSSRSMAIRNSRVISGLAVTMSGCRSMTMSLS